MPRTLNRPIVLGIVGDSATGKTTLSTGVAKILSEERCTTICTDDYHRYSRAERRDRGISALDPRANFVNILEQHLQHLRRGERILKPVYDHTTGTRLPAEQLTPKDFVIVEGLLGYTTRAMRNCYDVKIYLEPEDDLRIKWKIHRDTANRGYSREEVLESLERRSDDSPAYIHPQRTFADIVISFQKPNGANGSDAHLDVIHILRPTLPHPDLSPLFDGSGGSGLHLEMERDKDGKPVDVLHIEGNISNERAKRIEDLLWTLVPEAGHLRDQVGHYEAESGVNVSHPLALTQLMVAFHMVKAAMGVHAV
jgi:phosphoribulokinase